MDTKQRYKGAGAGEIEIILCLEPLLTFVTVFATSWPQYDPTGT